MTEINAYAAMEAGGSLEAYSYDPGPLSAHDVEIDVMACGVCHSDLSMVDNSWHSSQYPLIPGHEAVGRIRAKGEAVTTLEVGQMVGVGWNAQSCQACQPCLSGTQQRCQTGVSTIRSNGGFADRVRVQDIWAVPIPDGIDPVTAGPLFCGGITVFAPFVNFGLKPTDRVGVIGIGGLGHLALQFANAWGCEVTAFTSSQDKMDELKKLGAHRVVNSRDKDAIKAERGHFDFIISTVNVSLNWPAYLAALRPNGQLITVGGVAEPMGIPAFSLIGGGKSVGGSDTGAPHEVATMLEFCARHDIKPMVETFPMSEVNAAIDHLKSGKARYRIVLKNN
ncbi:oxidoreductase [Litorimonas cladophorae]|uniref:alcohol dehydrogenase (NADP(+)) n=1 Tax=Litorimonas cladophorae TaxID=1220491 RepID=A0A918KCC3_9PROT|nr:NAD(P)-dependent alcohol dehydrogenase [Litorimonas cladophorae]GGX58422.1 oxidoreductase [Litorimonas cladophorae]